ncbi:MAG: aldehyde ferredoxin oxidoreductase [Clostridia bacterium]|nr:aldehyde ferredoxin oxidoreductase [Clostridia bacterium]
MSVKNGINGWAGSVLRINLTTGSITTEDTLPKYKPFIGGMGLGYKVIWDEVPMTADPLGPEAKAVFAVGPLTASGVPCSGRMNVSFLSCWSKGFSIVDAHMGGHIAHAFKYAGYDALILEGQSDKPVYIKIDDDKVSIEDASHVWGKGTFETNATLTKAAGDEFDVASIGLAGENMVPMSCMVTSFGNSGGAGLGALMGSKKVKALVVRGTGAVKIARPLEVKLLSNYMIKDLVGGNNNHNVPTIPQSWAEYSATSSNRWQGGPGVTWDKAPNGPIDMGEQPSGVINVAALRCNKGVFDFGAVAEKYTVKQGGCSSCPVRCYTEYDMDPLADYDLPTHVSNTCMPIIKMLEWYPDHVDAATGEKVKSYHDFVDEGDAKMILGGAGARAADEYGVWCNYGNLYEDFYMAYTSGVLKDVITKGGTDMTEWDSIPWNLMETGDPKWLFEVYRRIAAKEGVFSDIGLGTYLLYEKWGMDDASKNVAGINFYDFVNGKNFNIGHNGYPRHHGPENCWQAGTILSLLYNRDCMIHHMINFIQSGSPYEDVIKPVLESFFGEGCVDKQKAYTPINENKIKLTKWAFLGKQWHDSSTLCNWMYPMTLATSPKRGYKGDLDLDAKYMSAVVGEEYTRESLEFDCERISNLLRVMTAVSFKENLGSTNLRQDHDQPSEWVFDKEPDFKAFEEGTVKLDRDDYQKSLDLFYTAMGWNVETGIPTRETLEKFDLKDCADKLEALGLI